MPKTDLLRGVKFEPPTTEDADSYHLDVPLYNQLSEPALKWGCEVTALGMLLAYYGFDGDKNRLQEAIEKVPYIDEFGLMGNPNIGFVGDATGENPGTGVNHEPVAQLAQKIVASRYQVIDATGSELDTLLTQVKEGKPVWVAVTIDYQIPLESDFHMWQTRQGPVQVTFKHHAAIITGYDKEAIYLNDAYGKQVTVERHQFEQIYQGMGKQGIYIEGKDLS
nr:C39 family peptidase [Vagococcus allomyrinae]